MALALEKERLFFQIYQSLEKELLGMTDYIHFSENNLDVYSVKLANFILTLSQVFRVTNVEF